MEKAGVVFYASVREYRKALKGLFPAKAAVLQSLQAVIADDGQRVTAERIGISAQYLSDIVNGRRGLSEVFLDRVNQAGWKFCNEPHE